MPCRSGEEFAQGREPSVPSACLDIGRLSPTSSHMRTKAALPGTGSSSAGLLVAFQTLRTRSSFILSEREKEGRIWKLIIFPAPRPSIIFFSGRMGVVFWSPILPVVYPVAWPECHTAPAQSLVGSVKHLRPALFPRSQILAGSRDCNRR